LVEIVLSVEIVMVVPSRIVKTRGGGGVYSRAGGAGSSRAGRGGGAGAYPRSGSGFESPALGLAPALEAAALDLAAAFEATEARELSSDGVASGVGVGVGDVRAMAVSGVGVG
jgi:hypothetical protein